MQQHETGSWLARDGDGRVLEVDAGGQPAREASPDDGRAVAEAGPANLERPRESYDAAYSRAKDAETAFAEGKATREELDQSLTDYRAAEDLLWEAVTPAEPPADACKCGAPVCRSAWPNPFLIYPAEREAEAG
jgi:hypothetical protein